MTPDREQIRRDAEEAIRTALKYRPIEGQELHVKAVEALDALLAELEQAERERDANKAWAEAGSRDAKKAWAEALAAEARLAKVPALVEALRMVTPSSDGTHELLLRPTEIRQMRDALAAWEQE